MLHDQHHTHYMVGNGGVPERPRDPVRTQIQRLRELEDVLLLWSIPALIATMLLWAVGSALGVNVPFLASIVDVLVTLLTLLAACVLLLKWIDMLQVQGHQCTQRMVDEQTRLRFLGVGGVCLVLIALILGTAANGGGESRTALLILLFLLFGWHYRTLLKRDQPAPSNREKKD